MLLAGGGIAAVRLKHELPNYGVFDEKRVFSAGGLPDPVEFAGASLGAMICEDMWLPEVGGHLAARGAEILIVPNGSPFELDKHDVRRRIALERVRENRLPLIYVNQVGGQDELVFDGGSFVMAADGTLAGQCPYWRADLAITRWERDAAGWRCVEAPASPEPGRLEAVYQAMVLGLRDYVEKNRFPGVVLGLSGGIDSALSAAVAVDALGAGRVHCVMLPSKYTSKESLDEAADCARRLGVKLDTISIAPLVECAERTLAPLFAGRAADLTEENIQSRLRGVLLMALSNKFGPMVLTTGNKSEVSVGYATLYGDMCGGYSVLKDVYKMLVFELSRWRNAHLSARRARPGGRRDTREHDRQAAHGRAAAEPEGPGQPAALRAARRGARGPGGERAPRRRYRRQGLFLRAGDQGPEHALRRRIQAAPGLARRQGDAQEFRPRPPLSDYEPVPQPLGISLDVPTYSRCSHRHSRCCRGSFSGLRSQSRGSA